MPRSLSDVPVVTNDRCPVHPLPSSGDRSIPSSALGRDHELVAAKNDPAAMERLVREYERYARSLAGRLHRGNEPREDLDQVALEALVVALRRYDPARGIPFPAFATPTILGSLRRHYRDHGWLIRVSRPVHELAGPLRQATDQLTAATGRPPTDEELAQELDVDLREVRVTRAAMHARTARSLDGGSEDLELGESVGTVDRNFELVEDLLAARGALRQLAPRERLLLGRYYLEGRSQAEVGEELGVSQMQVSRLLRSALRRVRQLVEVPQAA